MNCYAQNTASKNTLQILWVLDLSSNVILQIFRNLNVKEALTSHEFKFLLGKHLFLHQGTSRYLCLPFMTDTMIIFFSIHFLKLNHNAHICAINLASCKNLSDYWIPMATISGKIKYICWKDLSSKLFFSKGLNLCRTT